MKKDLNDDLIVFIKIGAFFIVLAFVFYFINFGFQGLSNDQEVWAQFGDYFGGVLNPVFAFLAFIALLITINLQNKALTQSKEELELTRKELEKSTKAQEAQSESLELQNKATKVQMFENTFFKLLELHNKKYDLLNKNIDIYNNQILRENESSETIDYMLGKFKTNKTDELRAYLLTLFELLFFVDKENNENLNLYIGLLKAYINNKFIITYIAIDGMLNAKFKLLIEKYVLLEHLNLIGRKRQDEICLVLVNFDTNAFGANDYLKNMIDIKRKKSQPLTNPEVL
ncbi:MAG: hypothetical protein WBF48_00715 [Halarcobacter sp.]